MCVSIFVFSFVSDQSQHSPGIQVLSGILQCLFFFPSTRPKPFLSAAVKLGILTKDLILNRDSVGGGAPFIPTNAVHWLDFPAMKIPGSSVVGPIEHMH